MMTTPDLTPTMFYIEARHNRLYSRLRNGSDFALITLRFSLVLGTLTLLSFYIHLRRTEPKRFTFSICQPLHSFNQHEAVPSPNGTKGHCPFGPESGCMFVWGRGNHRILKHPPPPPDVSFYYP